MPNGKAGSNGPADPDPTIEAVRAIVRASRMLERASGELSLAHYRVLAAISAGEERASRVAQRLAVGKPTVSAAVDVLVQRGLVARHIEVADNRVTVLRVTSEGWDVLARVEAGMVERLTRLAELTGDADGLVGCLARLGRALDESRAAQGLGRSGSAP
jgi:DNA-binding MarR family transcriptional regulator